MIDFFFSYFHAVWIYFNNIIFNTSLLEKIVLVLPYIVFELPFAVGMVTILVLKYYFGFFH